MRPTLTPTNHCDTIISQSNSLTYRVTDVVHADGHSSIRYATVQHQALSQAPLCKSNNDDGQRDTSWPNARRSCTLSTVFGLQTAISLRQPPTGDDAEESAVWPQHGCQSSEYSITYELMV